AAVAPEVETELAKALERASKLERIAWRIGAKVEQGSISIDGRSAVCVVPCVVDVIPGDHVVKLDADGIVPAAKMVRADAGARELALEIRSAPPELAGAQWTARYASSTEIESAASVRLLATALRAQRLVLVAAEPQLRGLRLKGVFSIDGRVAARAERTIEAGEVEEQSWLLVRDLLVEGRIVEPAPPLVHRPPFWKPIPTA